VGYDLAYSTLAPQSDTFSRRRIKFTVMRMDSEEYKRITSLWNVKRRGIIDDSLSLIMGENSDLANKLKSTLASTPVQKPERHTGGKETDYIEVLLHEEETQEFIDLLFDLEGAAVPQGTDMGFENEAIQAREASRMAG